jgi:hemoglobin
MTAPRIVAGIPVQFQRAGTISRTAASSAVNQHGDAHSARSLHTIKRRFTPMAPAAMALSRPEEEGTVMRIVLARVSTAVVAAVVVSMAGAATQTAKAQVKQPSLYERLGGAYSIATVVDDFIERLLVNTTLNANPAIKEARARVPKAGLKFHVTTLVCEVSGGPCKYTGRTMKESHERLNITQAEWDAMVVDFKATLKKFNVPQREQQELITIVGSTKNDIVRSSSVGRQ